MNDVMKRLSASRIFGVLSQEDLDLVASSGVLREIERDDTLFEEGEEIRSLVLIVSGQIELVQTRFDEYPHPLVLLSPGDTIGDYVLIQPSAHTTTARAVSAVMVCEFDVGRLEGSLADRPGVFLTIVRRVARAMQRRLQFASPRQHGLKEVYKRGHTRTEHDLLGKREVPRDALYGIQTLRARENFPITGIELSHFPELLRSLAMIKQAAARANERLDLLEPKISKAIDRACQEVIDGHWHGHFVVDMVQGGAGTSTNMNANEVIANRALEILGCRRGEYERCHPNNHVNLSQSTNDVYPTAMRIATIQLLEDLQTALRVLRDALREKGEAFATVLKMGRTQLQDAVPMTLGQEFTAFAVTTDEDISRLGEIAGLFLEINLGGTAIGTGINAPPRYPEIVLEELRVVTALKLRLAENLVEATPDTGAFVLFSGAIKRVAVKLSKMCNDLRLLSSGPRCGLSEISLPPVQPGSSIMPGKVNPVIPEVVNQVAYQVIGNDLTITMAAEAGQLQLNVMEPIITFNLFQSMNMLTAAIHTLAKRCIRGITANESRARALVEGSIGIVTALVPVLGYEMAGEVAKEALETGRSVRDIVLARGHMTAERLDELLSVDAMTRPRQLPR